MNTKKNHFKVDKLDFSTIDVSEREFFTIQYVDPDFTNALDIMGGKVYLLIDDLPDKFSVGLWVEGEPVMGFDEQMEEIVKTDVEKESYYIEYKFSLTELDAIKLRIIEFFHCFIYGGRQYALSEMSA